MTGGRPAPRPRPQRCGDCAVFVSLCRGGRRVGPAPEICSVLPRNAGWRPALWCLCPCINGSGFVAWFSCMFLLRGPASAFRFCKHRPRSRPAPHRGAAWGGGRVSGLGFAFAVVTKNVRVAFLFYPVAPVPGAAWAHWALMQSGRGSAGAPPGPCWRSAPQRRGLLLDLVSSSGPPRMWEPLQLPASASRSGAGAT